MTTHLKQTLDTHPELKKEFDLTVAVHPGARNWFAWWLKKIHRVKTEFDEVDVEAYRLAFFKIRQRKFANDNELFAACNSIVPDAYRMVDKQRQQRNKEMRGLPTMKNILGGMK